MFSIHQLQLTCYSVSFIVLNNKKSSRYDIRVVLQEPESESCIGVNFSEILITGKKSSSQPSKKG